MEKQGFPLAEHPTRKLAVILHADVVGSTALVQMNELVAHERMQNAFRRFSSTIESFGGIAREIRGDALVAEFARASDAISASLAFQSANAACNDGLQGDIRPVVRVTGQLIDAASGNHLWAERYDRDLEDIFAVQDEVVRAIAGAIPGHLNRFEVEHIRRKPPGNLTAYDCELRGRLALSHWNEGLETAIEWFERSVEADPDYALAHAALAMAYVYGLYVLGLPSATVLARGEEHAARAIALDDRNPTVNAYAAFAYHVAGVHALARKHAARAVELNPNDPFVLYVQACALSYTGDPEKALEWFAKSEQLGTPGIYTNASAPPNTT